MARPTHQHIHTLITTDLHWQENGELHPDDLARLRDRLLADAALDHIQQEVIDGWVCRRQEIPV